MSRRSILALTAVAALSSSCLASGAAFAELHNGRLSPGNSGGVNAIRTAHNPPDPAFLDLCDRMGFLVMDELFDCWEVAKALVPPAVLPNAGYRFSNHGWTVTLAGSTPVRSWFATASNA